MQFERYTSDHTTLTSGSVWSTGQDQMRIIKQRLLEMMPDLSIFLDVDDLEDISDLEGYVDRSAMILIFCSKGYFQSKNCMREIRSCTEKGKPMIAVLDPDSSSGALSLDEVKGELIAADACYEKWGFTDDGGPDGMAPAHVILTVRVAPNLSGNPSPQAFVISCAMIPMRRRAMHRSALR